MESGRVTRNSSISKRESVGESTNIEQRHVIRYFYRNSTTVKVIRQKLVETYGDSALGERQVYKWVDAFKAGKNNVEDDERCGRPRTSTTPETIKAVEKIVMSDRRKKIREIAQDVRISNSSVWKILHEELKLNKICSRWVPHDLSPLHKQTRVQCSKDNLDFLEGDKSFFPHLVTGDETWVHFYDPESKQESMQWKHKGSPAPKKFKVQKSAGKVLATVFWDMKGILLIEFTEKGHTITGQSYKKTIESLRQAVLKKRLGGEKRRILLLHDNAPAHTSHVARATIREQGMIELFHPPYSPDLAPSDYYLFRNLKSFLRGQKFSSNSEVKGAVANYFEEQDENFFSKGILSLESKWARCIELEGDYIEKH
jgi:histone-lysine N-methyltransferase SETMAR